MHHPKFMLPITPSIYLATFVYQCILELVGINYVQ